MWVAPGTTTTFFFRTFSSCFIVLLLTSITSLWSFPPTMNKVGARTFVNRSVEAKSGLPLRHTTAPIWLTLWAAAIKPAAAPVLAPKYPMIILWVSNCFVVNNQSVILSRRSDSNFILNLFNMSPGILHFIFSVRLSVSSSSFVRRSISRVASPSLFKALATYSFRGLCLPLLLPWANTIIPLVMFQLLGIVRLPSSIVVATTLLLAACTGILTIFSIVLLVECSPVIYNPSVQNHKWVRMQIVLTLYLLCPRYYMTILEFDIMVLAWLPECRFCIITVNCYSA
jgi:hypothetical protein